MRQVHQASVCDPLPSTTPSHYPTKRESQRVTHRCLALSPLSTCGETLPSSGQNSRHRASSRRRCYSTNLGSRASGEQLCPRAPGLPQALADSAFASIPTPGQAAWRLGQTSMSLCPHCSSTQKTDGAQLAALPCPPLRLGKGMKVYKAPPQQGLNTDRCRLQVPMPAPSSVNALAQDSAWHMRSA